MLRLRLVIPLLVVATFGSGFLMGEDKKTDKEPLIVRARLPTYYSKLGLSQKQRNTIYKVHGRYTAEIQELYDKIKELRDKDREDCEKVLTAEQKARLRQILLGGRGKKTDSEEAEEAPAKTTKKKDTTGKDKKKDSGAKDKKGPVEIRK